MFDFIQRNKYVLLITMGTIIVVLSVILFVVNRGAQKPQTNTNTGNDLNYSFLKAGLSKEDEYLMLQGKIISEEFGTYSNDDYRGLLDVQNQSTDEFKSRIQTIIDSLANATTNVNTSIDPDTVKLIKGVGTAEVTMTGAQTSNNTTGKISSTVKMVKQGSYWLVQDITVTYQ